jgi:hypothetical protein
MRPVGAIAPQRALAATNQPTSAKLPGTAGKIAKRPVVVSRVEISSILFVASIGLYLANEYLK